MTVAKVFVEHSKIKRSVGGGSSKVRVCSLRTTLEYGDTEISHGSVLCCLGSSVRVLLVGQAPSRVMRPGDRPFERTAALTRLATYAAVSTRERLYELFDFINVIEDYPGKSDSNPKYDAFDLEVAKLGRKRVEEHILSTSPSRVVTLGRASSDVMRGSSSCRRVECSITHHNHYRWFRWYRVTLGSYSYLTSASPHPGGTSMYWNAPDARAYGEYFWRNLVEGIERDRRTSK